jgi:hypothetical protein
MPKGKKHKDGTEHQGSGPRAGAATATPAKPPVETIDFATLMERLPRTVNSSSLAKALQMLKADRFQLYAEVKDAFLVGVVKSQTNPELVYSCQLGADGAFSCCTQNLRACGGLHGKLCKHLLVLLVGLAKTGKLEPVIAERWAQASRKQRPVLDKDVMSETFLRYKGAEAGEVDWRPTETIPEDYYAL